MTTSISQTTSVRRALTEPVGTKARVHGWVRTRRDSKAGLSFIALDDGSCFDNLQLVAPNDLPNYEDEVLHLTTGCAIEAEGELVESKGKGQSVELKASAVRRRVGRGPGHLPRLGQAPHLRVPARLRPSAGADQHLRRGGPRAARLAMAVHRFMDERVLLGPHAHHHRQRREGAGEMFRVSTLDAVNPPRSEDGTVDFGRDFFGREAYLTVSGQLNVETYCWR